MYDGSQNGMGNETKTRQVWSGKQNKNDIKVGIVTGGSPKTCFYLLEDELKQMLARL